MNLLTEFYQQALFVLEKGGGNYEENQKNEIHID